MREIKFRAWHFTHKKMFCAEEMAQDQLGLLPTGNFINVHHDPIYSIIIPHEIMIPMQYTGLKDCNGVDIYEGDILQANIANACQWVVLWNFEVNGWGLKRFIDGQEEVCYGIRNCLQIIGNIYENPELLGEKL